MLPILYLKFNPFGVKRSSCVSMWYSCVSSALVMLGWSSCCTCFTTWIWIPFSYQPPCTEKKWNDSSLPLGSFMVSMFFVSSLGNVKRCSIFNLVANRWKWDVITASGDKLPCVFVVSFLCQWHSWHIEPCWGTSCMSPCTEHCCSHNPDSLQIVMQCVLDVT